MELKNEERSMKLAKKGKKSSVNSLINHAFHPMFYDTKTTKYKEEKLCKKEVTFTKLHTQTSLIKQPTLNYTESSKKKNY